ncbi:MAG: OmpA family protein [Burkholderiaceae bacterium]|nr:OmpA family protein [Burkholderiaceae bacterium]
MTTLKVNARRCAGMTGTLALPALLAACASLDPHPVATAARAPSPAASYRIAQLGYGDARYYGFCLAPVCPDVTPKTPATPGNPVARPGPGDNPTAPMPPVATRPPLVLQFRTGSAVLDAHAGQQLAQWTARAGRAGRIMIAGRTDDVGAEALNHRLASARARVVADHLRDRLGVAPARLSWQGRGVCCYVGDNATVAGRQANRRAEVTLQPLMEVPR